MMSGVILTIVRFLLCWCCGSVQVDYTVRDLSFSSNAAISPYCMLYESGNSAYIHTCTEARVATFSSCCCQCEFRCFVGNITTKQDNTSTFDSQYDDNTILHSTAHTCDGSRAVPLSSFSFSSSICRSFFFTLRTFFSTSALVSAGSGITCIVHSSSFAHSGHNGKEDKPITRLALSQHHRDFIDK